MVVDPDKDKIYTKRKTRLSNLPAERSPETPAPKYPSDGWGKSLERMPPFSRAEMNQHIESFAFNARDTDVKQCNVITYDFSTKRSHG